MQTAPGWRGVLKWVGFFVILIGGLGIMLWPWVRPQPPSQCEDMCTVGLVFIFSVFSALASGMLWLCVKLGGDVPAVELTICFWMTTTAVLGFGLAFSSILPQVLRPEAPRGTGIGP